MVAFLSNKDDNNACQIVWTNLCSFSSITSTATSKSIVSLVIESVASLVAKSILSLVTGSADLTGCKEYIVFFLGYKCLTGYKASGIKEVRRQQMK